MGIRRAALCLKTYDRTQKFALTKLEAQLLRLLLDPVTPAINAPGIPVQADRPTGPHGETGFGLVYPSPSKFFYVALVQDLRLLAVELISDHVFP